MTRNDSHRKSFDDEPAGALMGLRDCADLRGLRRLQSVALPDFTVARVSPRLRITADPIGLNRNRDGTLEESYGNDELIGFISSNNNAFQPGEWTLAQTDFRAHTNEWMWLNGQPRLHCGFYSFDFFVRNRDRHSACADNAHHSGSGQYGNPAIQGVKSAEHIPGKERLVQFFDTIRPAATDTAEREVFIESPFAQTKRNSF